MESAGIFSTSPISFLANVSLKTEQLFPITNLVITISHPKVRYTHISFDHYPAVRGALTMFSGEIILS